jgi:hypothetical protein
MITTMMTIMENLPSVRVVEYMNLLLLIFILFAIIFFARSLDPLIWDVARIREDFENFIQGFTELSENELQDGTEGKYEHMPMTEGDGRKREDTKKKI